MLRRTALWAGLVGLYVIVTLCPASCQLSEEDTETLVELHNSYRGQVVPNATYMRKVKWDEKLKIVAEGYAVKCTWEHNPDLEELNTGENLFVSNGPFDPNIAMEKWFLEHLDYDYNNNSCQDDKMCGHYTQMVWADSHSVGCATHRCDTMEGLSFEKVTFLVCNYYPAGNFNDEKPYEEGERCSKCPDNLPRCDQNLCVPDASEPSEEPDTEKETTDSSPPGTDEPSTATSTATATKDTELESTQPDHSSAPKPTMADRDETGTEPGDEEEEGEELNIYKRK
ncbi:peptidase inhibitor 16 [Coregonus clupeaformis]|uniref:peptidase inhibitor 16 n=1 Tax=Coregonus clupeaformis TaxID=59861 RepID=UPI001E1C5D97|nr:peptidase inhibitor 16 [Coregonus clupeaformis]